MLRGRLPALAYGSTRHSPLTPHHLLRYLPPPLQMSASSGLLRTPCTEGPRPLGVAVAGSRGRAASW